MTFARAQRPASVALAAAASVLLLAGAVPVGVVLAAGAVVTAWAPGRTGAREALDD